MLLFQWYIVSSHSCACWYQACTRSHSEKVSYVNLVKISNLRSWTHHHGKHEACTEEIWSGGDAAQDHGGVIDRALKSFGRKSLDWKRHEQDSLSFHRTDVMHHICSFNSKHTFYQWPWHYIKGGLLPCHTLKVNRLCCITLLTEFILVFPLWKAVTAALPLAYK